MNYSKQSASISPTRFRTIGACTECRRAKIKCESQNPDPCKRCTMRGYNCHYPVRNAATKARNRLTETLGRVYPVAERKTDDSSSSKKQPHPSPPYDEPSPQGWNQIHIESIYNGSADFITLDRLASYAMLGAAFDCSTRDPPRCHPGTRKRILQSLQERLHDLNQITRLLWFPGPVGVGKTAIVRTLAKAEAESSRLAASLLFSKLGDCNDPHKVFTTIAYQFAINDHVYQQYLAERIEENPSFLNKSMELQFESLITIPLGEKRRLGDIANCVIILDGLDECHGEREQFKIIELITDFIFLYPSVPLTWVIASRPEQHLRVAFSRANSRLKTSYYEEKLHIDSEEGARDVELYLNHAFTEIRNHYDLPDWPSEEQFTKILKAASGFFVFASAIIRVVDDPSCGDPVSRLSRVLIALERGSTSQDTESRLFEELDMLYGRAMSGVRPELLNTAKCVLGYLLIRPCIENTIPASPFWICNILGIERHLFYEALHKLQSLLAIPESQNALDEDVRFLHSSLSDFLKDHRRSKSYTINMDEVATHLWHRSVTILQQWTKDHSYDGIEIYWQLEGRGEVSHLEQTLVSIAGKCWPTLLGIHLEDGPTPPFRLGLPTPDLIEQLKVLDYSYLQVLDPSHSTAIRLISCLKNQKPATLWNSIIHDMPLTSLSHKRLIRSLHERRWFATQSTNMKEVRCKDPFHAGLSEQEKEDKNIGNDIRKGGKFLQKNCIRVDMLFAEMESADAPKIMMTVLGTRPSKCRGILNIPFDETPYSSDYYSFPYLT